MTTSKLTTSKYTKTSVEVKLLKAHLVINAWDALTFIAISEGNHDVMSICRYVPVPRNHMYEILLMLLERKLIIKKNEQFYVTSKVLEAIRIISITNTSLYYSWLVGLIGETK